MVATLPRLIFRWRKEYTGTGGMLAWYPPPSLAKRLAIPDGEKLEHLHLTLAFFKDASAIDRQALIDVLEEVASLTPPLTGVLNGVGRFTASDNSDGKDVCYLNADVPGLVEFRTRLVDRLAERGIEASRDHGYTPHMTLAYVTPDQPLPLTRLEPEPITIDAVQFVVGETLHTARLTGTGQVAYKYSEDQERDEQGRWTAGGDDGRLSPDDENWSAWAGAVGQWTSTIHDASAIRNEAAHIVEHGKGNDPDLTNTAMVMLDAVHGGATIDGPVYRGLVFSDAFERENFVRDVMSRDTIDIPLASASVSEVRAGQFAGGVTLYAGERGVMFEIAGGSPGQYVTQSLTPYIESEVIIGGRYEVLEKSDGKYGTHIRLEPVGALDIPQQATKARSTYRFNSQRARAEQLYRTRALSGLQRVQKNAISRDMKVDEKFWATQKGVLKDALGTLPQRTLLTGITQASQLGVVFDSTLVHKTALELIPEYIETWLDDIANTSSKQIMDMAEALQQYVIEGDMKSLTAQLEPVFGEARADMIATTEVTRLYSLGNMEAFAAGNVTSWEWMTAQDADVDPDCEELGDGGPYTIGELEPPPLHPRCRCFLAPVIDESVFEVEGPEE